MGNKELRKKKKKKFISVKIWYYYCVVINLFLGKRMFCSLNFRFCEKLKKMIFIVIFISGYVFFKKDI